MYAVLPLVEENYSPSSRDSGAVDPDPVQRSVPLILCLISGNE